ERFASDRPTSSPRLLQKLVRGRRRANTGDGAFRGFLGRDRVPGHEAASKVGIQRSEIRLQGGETKREPVLWPVYEKRAALEDLAPQIIGNHNFEGGIASWHNRILSLVSSRYLGASSGQRRQDLLFEFRDSRLIQWLGLLQWSRLDHRFRGRFVCAGHLGAILLAANSPTRRQGEDHLGFRSPKTDLSKGHTVLDKVRNRRGKVH